MTVMNIIGVQKVKGSVDGNSFDFSRVHAIAILDMRDTNKGYAGIELRALPAVSDKYLSFDFKPQGIPFEVEVTTVAAGKGTFKDVITSMTPVSELPKK